MISAPIPSSEHDVLLFLMWAIALVSSVLVTIIVINIRSGWRQVKRYQREQRTTTHVEGIRPRSTGGGPNHARRR